MCLFAVCYSLARLALLVFSSCLLARVCGFFGTGLSGRLLQYLWSRLLQDLDQWKALCLQATTPTSLAQDDPARDGVVNEGMSIVREFHDPHSVLTDVD